MKEFTMSPSCGYRYGNSNAALIFASISFMANAESPPIWRTLND
jgi:hypothetical protein